MRLSAGKSAVGRRGQSRSLRIPSPRGPYTPTSPIATLAFSADGSAVIARLASTLPVWEPQAASHAQRANSLAKLRVTAASAHLALSPLSKAPRPARRARLAATVRRPAQHLPRQPSHRAQQARGTINSDVRASQTAMHALLERAALCPNQSTRPSALLAFPAHMPISREKILALDASLVSTRIRAKQPLAKHVLMDTIALRVQPRRSPAQAAGSETHRLQ